MRISNSSIAMESQRKYSETLVYQSVSVISKQGKEIELKDSGGNLFDQLNKAATERSMEERMEELKAQNAISRPSYNGDGTKCVSSIRELKNLVLEQLLNRLDHKRNAYTGCLRKLSGYFGEQVSGGMSSATAVIENSGKYVVQTVQSEFYMEQEVTRFSTTGKVTLEDGRQIDIEFSMEMSRSYMETVETYTEGEFVLCDPLVINFNADATQLSDQKFYFDLDCDGEDDLISEFSSNSGFLALDLNEDGIINDGNELFGTKSGDGFADLGLYDLDKNGWIDENDNIF